MRPARAHPSIAMVKDALSCATPSLPIALSPSSMGWTLPARAHAESAAFHARVSGLRPSPRILSSSVNAVCQRASRPHADMAEVNAFACPLLGGSPERSMSSSSNDSNSSAVRTSPAFPHALIATVYSAAAIGAPVSRADVISETACWYRPRCAWSNTRSRLDGSKAKWRTRTTVMIARASQHVGNHPNNCTNTLVLLDGAQSNSQFSQ